MKKSLRLSLVVGSLSGLIASGAFASVSDNSTPPPLPNKVVNPAPPASKAEPSAIGGAVRANPNQTPVVHPIQVNLPNPFGCTSFAEPDQKMMDVLNRMMADRDHRLWHYLWHGLRNNWHAFSDDQREIFTTMNPAWGVTHMVAAPADAPNRKAKEFDPNQNGAGEDFLFMHHYMINMASAELRRNGLPCIAGWDTIPDPTYAGSSDPWAARAAQLAQMYPAKGRNFGLDTPQALLALKSHEAEIRGPFLRQMSLSQLGFVVEHSIHDNMHMRWADDTVPTPPGDHLPNILGDALNGDPDLSGIDQRLRPFDDPRYNWLGDTYSSHVNPVFWKLHGLVDHILQEWLVANGYSEIAVNCAGRQACYQWIGTWSGPMPGTPAFTLERNRQQNLGLDLLARFFVPLMNFAFAADQSMGHQHHAGAESIFMSFGRLKDAQGALIRRGHTPDHARVVLQKTFANLRDLRNSLDKGAYTRDIQIEFEKYRGQRGRDYYADASLYVNYLVHVKDEMKCRKYRKDHTQKGERGLWRKPPGEQE